MRRGFDRGVLGGNPVWLVLGALALLAHLAGRAMQRERGVVLRADLNPDEVSRSASSGASRPSPRRGSAEAASQWKGEGPLAQSASARWRWPARLAVQALLDRFELNRESVLVIVDGTLVTGDACSVEGSTIEVRPVISGGAGGGHAGSDEVPAPAGTGGDRHPPAQRRPSAPRASFATARSRSPGLEAFDMIARRRAGAGRCIGRQGLPGPGDLLLDLGVAADGLYLGLGIGEYSDESGRYARAFAESRQAPLVEIDLRGQFGFDIPTGAAAARRAPCSACGLSNGISSTRPPSTAATT